MAGRGETRKASVSTAVDCEVDLLEGRIPDAMAKAEAVVARERGMREGDAYSRFVRSAAPSFGDWTRPSTAERASTSVTRGELSRGGEIHSGEGANEEEIRAAAVLLQAAMAIAPPARDVRGVLLSAYGHFRNIPVATVILWTVLLLDGDDEDGEMGGRAQSRAILEEFFEGRRGARWGSHYLLASLRLYLMQVLEPEEASAWLRLNTLGIEPSVVETMQNAIALLRGGGYEERETKDERNVAAMDIDEGEGGSDVSTVHGNRKGSSSSSAVNRYLVERLKVGMSSLLLQLPKTLCEVLQRLWSSILQNKHWVKVTAIVLVFYSITYEGLLVALRRIQSKTRRLE